MPRSRARCNMARPSAHAGPRAAPSSMSSRSSIRATPAASLPSTATSLAVTQTTLTVPLASISKLPLSSVVTISLSTSLKMTSSSVLASRVLPLTRFSLSPALSRLASSTSRKQRKRILFFEVMLVKMRAACRDCALLSGLY